jgi:hypothetical protein
MYQFVKGHMRKGASLQGFDKHCLYATIDGVWGLRPRVNAAEWAALSNSTGGISFDERRHFDAVPDWCAHDLIASDSISR